MQALKRIGLVLGALVVLALGGVAIVASQFDAPRIKAELAKVVWEKKQRTLKIDGDVELSFWPAIGVRLGKVSLSERNSAEVFAAVESMRVAVAVRPLLSRRIVVDTIDVGGVEAALIKRKDGTLNIDDLLGADEAPSRPLQFDIAAVKLADIRLHWRDEQAGSSTTVSGLDLASGRIQADTGSKAFQIEALTAAVKGRIDADSFELRLGVPRLALAPAKASAAAATLTVALGGARRNANVKLGLAGIEGTAQALGVRKLTLDIAAGAGAATVKGTLDAALAADFERQTVALETLRGALDLVHPQLPMKRLKLPLAGALRADLARPSADGHLAASVDESKLALRFSVAKFAPLALGFDLDIDRLDVDKYLAPHKPATKENKAGDGKFDLSALKDVKLDGRVTIGSLQFAKVKASNVKLQVRAADGKLDIAAHPANAL